VEDLHLRAFGTVDKTLLLEKSPELPVLLGILEALGGNDFLLSHLEEWDQTARYLFAVQ
jgi:hypothetical protein